MSLMLKMSAQDEEGLIGSEKQIAWATEIRNKWINGIKDYMLADWMKTVLRRNPDLHKKLVEYVKEHGKLDMAQSKKMFIDASKEKKSSSWWIDNRYGHIGVKLAEEVLPRIVR